MKHAFETLVGEVHAALQAGEQFTLGYSAEQSQFVRFNHAKVRQAGEVSQASAQLRLVRDGRHIYLSGQIPRVGDTVVVTGAAGARCPPRLIRAAQLTSRRTR